MKLRALVVTLILACGSAPRGPAASGGSPGTGGEEPAPTGGSGGGGARGSGGSAPDAASTPDGPRAIDAFIPAPDTSAPDLAPAGAPLLGVLEQFTAADVPARGPEEAAPIPHYWTTPTATPMVPGNGLGQHPMLYAGEGYNVIFVINQGRVVWSYTLGAGGEVDDLWMLSNGHILIAFQHRVLEVTPKKQVVWKYDPPASAEVHTCQPVGLDRVLFVQNDTPPRVKLINKKTGAVELDRPLMAPGNANPGGVHTQFRRFRVTAAGTYLASFLSLNRVVEYDKDWNVLWDYPIATPWSALRLRNGNTLITSESTRTVREVSPKSATVWEWKQSDLPPGVVQQNTQTADRLSTGNTVIFASRSPKDPARPNIQALEVTPDKKTVWILQDWKDLGPATTAQFLDEPGLPENPGELQH